jgi:amino acid adenylation domain-containing protein
MTSSSSAKDRLATLSKDKTALLKLLLEEESGRARHIRPQPRGAGQTRFPASWAQQRLWFIDQLGAGSAAYHILVGLRLTGALDTAALQRAIDTIVHRHESLRTVFVSVDGVPHQEVRAEINTEIKIVDLRAVTGHELEERITNEKNTESQTRFDIRSGPLIRARLLKLREDEHLLLITTHHLVSDGWSSGVLLQELGELYSGYRAGHGNSLPPLTLQYVDFTHWQRQWMQGPTLDRQLAYWRARLEGAAPVLELPSDRPRPAVQSYRGHNLPILLRADLCAELRHFGQRHGMTLFMVLYMGWAILLSRLSRQQDIVIGTPLANRARAELEGMVGLFANTLVLRMQLHGAMRVTELIEQVKEVTRSAYDHQDMPFEKIVEVLQPERRLNRNPIFQVAMSLQNAPKREPRMAGLTASYEDEADEPALFDLLLALEERGEQIVGSLNHATDLFDASTVERWIACFEVLLRAMVKTPQLRIGELPILPEAERYRVVESFNATARVYPQDTSIHELFEAQVRRTPEAVAALCEGVQLTYEELNSKANQLARLLRLRGVRTGERIPVLMTRSMNMLIAQLAVLKCGGAYVPIDPKFPLERQRFMIRDCDARRVLVEGVIAEGLAQERVEWIGLETLATATEQLSTENLRLAVPGMAPAYVMYTSGSTGVPKGVVVPHCAVNRLVINTTYVQLEPTDCIVHASNPAFDASTFEIWGALLNGARLLIVPHTVLLDAARMAELLIEHRVTVLWMTIGLFAQYADALQAALGQLRYLIVGGDVVDPLLLKRVLSRRPPRCILNAYGPTECTTFSTTHRVDAVEEGKALPIGRPIANACAYILDAFLQPVPIGVVGEICIGGAGVALGYLNRPEQTAQSFVADPFSADPHARLYKSGDLGRWRPDGSIEFLGRNDQQVKVRGFRIELGEIEAQLLQHREVKEAIVEARADRLGQKRLLAYVTARPGLGLSAEELRRHLERLLPEHMIPAAFIVLDTFPLNANGKVDRKALPEPDMDAYVSRQFVAPQGEVEEVLANTWRELLGLERVGRHDNFFELGGHSLLMVQMLERLRRIGLSAQVRSVYESPTLEALARTLQRGMAPPIEVPASRIPLHCKAITPQMLPLVDLDVAQIERIVEVSPGGAENIQDIYPLAPLQEGMLFHHLLNETGGDTYVIATLLSVSSRARLDELISALQGVINRHDALRTAVRWEQLAKPVQVVYRQVQLPVEQTTLATDCDPLTAARRWIRPELQRLDLRQAPMMRLQVAPDPNSTTWYVLLQLHHIVCDHVTADVVISEAMAYLEGRQDALPPSVPYRNHVAQALAHARTHDAETFFRSKLADVVEPTAPFGLRDVHGDGSRIQESEEHLEGDLVRRIRERARRLGVSAATLFHAAWALVVAHTSARDDVVFGTVLLGRLQGGAGAQRIVGMFINSLPLRLQLRGLTASALVEQTQRELVELLNYEQSSLAVAQRCSGVSGSAPLFTALLNFRHSNPSDDASWSAANGIQQIAIQDRTNYPITVSVDDLGAGFSITAQTDQRIDPHRLVSYVHTAVAALVTALEQMPQTMALELPILPRREWHEVIESFNATGTEADCDSLVQIRFEQQVQRTPDAIAVAYEHESYTYAEINGQANQLARYLRQQGVDADQVVGISMERSLRMIVGLLGILKAGGAYLPLDPNYPAERLRLMLNDAQPSLVLTQRSLRGVLPATEARLIEVDDHGEEIARHSRDNLSAAEVQVHPRNLLYVIYTSGSTGRPKGTAMEHRSMVNLIDWHRSSLPPIEGKPVLQFAALSFDVAFQEIFSTLATGGTLVLLDEWMRKDVRALTAVLNRHGVERLFVPPVMLQSLAEHLVTTDEVPHTLQDVITAGEQLRITPEIVQLFERLGRARLHNHYGPTESHVVTTLSLEGDPRAWPVLPSIGKPLANSQIYLLDQRRQPVPVGVEGEIYIGGVNLARGYLRRPELTAERFVAHPFSADSQMRLYRTGDLGRWQANGSIEYLGRNDDQVKIRGFRVELGEIEARLTQHPQVREVAVVAREDAAGGKRLVAYITVRDANAPGVEELRAHLIATLPEHMIPSAFVSLEHLPLTPSGKLDRRALPAPDMDAFVSRDYEPPRGELEEILAGIWQELLKVERVGRRGNFFELGGHSLLIVQMMERLRRIGLSATVRGIYDSPTLSDLARTLAQETIGPVDVPANAIPQECAAITPQMLPLVRLEQSHIDRIVGAVPGGAANIQDIYPLAPLQEGILFHHLLDDEQADTYVLPILLTLVSKAKLNDFVAALERVIERHDILRTAVHWEDLPQPVQVVHRRVVLPVAERVPDPSCDPLEYLRSRMAPELLRLDMRCAPMMRLEVAADSDGERWHVLLLVQHFVCDHESIEVMLSELVTCLEGAADTLPKAAPYRNHVAQVLAHAREHDAERFFRNKLGSVEEPTAPFGLLEVRGDVSRLAQVQRALDPELTQRLRAQARRHAVSAATLFHAAWGLVAATTTGQHDVVFGTVLLGRMQSSAGAQRTLGMFMNTLPLRLSLAKLTATELVKRTQRELVELLTHEQASLAVAQRCSGILGSTPLFSTLLNYRHSAADVDSNLARAGVDFVAINSWTNYPIVLSIDDFGQAFLLSLDVDRSIDGERLLGYVQTALQSLVEALEDKPQKPALELPILPEGELQEMLESFNPTHRPYPQQKLVHQLFEEQAARTPNALAVTDETQSLSYVQLNTRANQLARWLRAKGVGPDVLVGLCVERSVEMVVGLFGILKAGGAYVPLDPGYPPERLSYMLQDAAPRVLLIQEHVKQKLKDVHCEVLALDAQWGEIAGNEETDLDASSFGVRADHLAYVIYTSGSTGKPKGVMIQHHCVVNLDVGLEAMYGDKRRVERVALNASLNFDASVQQLVHLLHGRTLHLVPQELRRDPARFRSFIDARRIEAIDCTPSQLKAWLTAGLFEERTCPLRVVLVGGEAIDVELWRTMAHHAWVDFHNVYGPTECTVDSTAAHINRDAGPPHIGRPMPNRRVYVLGRDLTPVPIGVAGEIYIGGEGMARGYLNRPDLTAERFRPDPFMGEASAKMYQTGDIGRWRADGVLEYLGRNDDQVKIRGFRIELGEIEAELLKHEAIKDAVVIAREDTPGDKRLVGYMTARTEGALDLEDVRRHLQSTLPEHMVPSAMVVMDAIPLTASGKRNRRALPAPTADAYIRRQYEAPQGEFETLLAQLWQELLHVDRVGRNDNFFELGGHSLLAMRLVAKIATQLHVKLPVISVFNAATVARLAIAIEARLLAEAPVDKPEEADLEEGVL